MMSVMRMLVMMLLLLLLIAVSQSPLNLSCEPSIKVVKLGLIRDVSIGYRCVAIHHVVISRSDFECLFMKRLCACPMMSTVATYG